MATLALVIFGVSIGIKLENKFGEKDDKSDWVSNNGGVPQFMLRGFLCYNA